MLDATQWHSGRFWEDDRIVVPANRISKVIAQYHDNMVAGHWGVPRTTAIVTRRFSFQNIKQHVHQHVTTCPQCQIVKADRHQARGKLEPLTLPIRKWQSVSMD